VQGGLLASPVNVFASPVREVNQLRLPHLNYPRALVIEAPIVLGNHGIMGSDFV
jgi:hypothetical protein